MRQGSEDVNKFLGAHASSVLLFPAALLPAVREGFAFSCRATFPSSFLFSAAPPPLAFQRSRTVYPHSRSNRYQFRKRHYPWLYPAPFSPSLKSQNRGKGPQPAGRLRSQGSSALLWLFQTSALQNRWERS